MIICPWCGFDRLPDDADLCAVCGQTPNTSSVRLVSTAELSGATTELHEPEPQAQPMARVFADRYVIEQTIGRGGMGSVFRVVDQQSGETLALKILYGTANLKRFQREAELLARVGSDVVPKIHDSGIADGLMYLVTEFIDGVNLRDALAAKGALPLADVVRIGATIADCLTAAHECGVIHRDIKPHNVMLTRNGGVRLIDFGIARDAAVNATAITGSSTMLGTPLYMAPEQFNAERTDARTDIYSLGVLLFEVATARLPFVADTPTALAVKHVTEAAPHPRALRAEIPMMLDYVILKCLEKNPADRYATAADVARDLRRSLEGRRSVRRTRSGDFIIREETPEEWDLVIASAKEKPWSAGMTLLHSGSYFRLERIDFDETYPAPFVHRFTFWPENEVMRRVVDYDAEAATPPAAKRWFR